MAVPLADAVLDVVEAVPVGRVVTYGQIADLLGRGGARGVGRVMSLEGAAVTWWRVVRADGGIAEPLADEARQRWRAEGVPVRGLGDATRVDLDRARIPTPDLQHLLTRVHERGDDGERSRSSGPAGRPG